MGAFEEFQTTYFVDQPVCCTFRLVMRRLLLVLAILLARCDRFPRKVAMDDPRIQPLLKAAASFDRVSYGFTPIPVSAEVRFESHPTQHPEQQR